MVDRKLEEFVESANTFLDTYHYTMDNCLDWVIISCFAL